VDSMVELIRGVRAGDRTEFDRLFASLYDELRRVARRQLRDRRPGEMLDTDALVHETYLRMVDQTRAEWADRAHFFAYASRAMRAVVVDYARRQYRAKRGGGRPRFSLDERDLPVEEQSEFILSLDQESPGSSPGGAMKPGNDLAVAGLCLFARLPWFRRSFSPPTYPARVALAPCQERLQVPNELGRTLPVERMPRLRVDLELGSWNGG